MYSPTSWMQPALLIFVNFYSFFIRFCEVTAM